MIDTCELLLLLLLTIGPSCPKPSAIRGPTHLEDGASPPLAFNAYAGIVITIVIYLFVVFFFLQQPFKLLYTKFQNYGAATAKPIEISFSV
jgi:hypothetical protein